MNAACGEDGLLLGAPRALSGLESQGRSFESGSRGVCAKPKPSSASAIVCPGPCDRAGSCTKDRKEREREREGWKRNSSDKRQQLGPPLSSYQHLRSQLKEAEEGPVIIIITVTLRSRTSSCERPASDQEEVRPASPLRRLPTISQLPIKFVWTSGRANKDKAWVFLEAIGYGPKTKQNKNLVSF